MLLNIMQERMKQKLFQHTVFYPQMPPIPPLLYDIMELTEKNPFMTEVMASF
jgi:hypothetical protein